ncbi:MAG: mercury(II) reductase [Gemmatimonadota bacterium]
MTEGLKRIHLDIQGMTCTSCERHVADALNHVEGAQAVEVRYPEGKAAVDLAPDADPQALVRALAGTPYSATLKRESGNGSGGAGPAHPFSTLAVEEPTAGKGAYDIVVVGAGSAGFAAAISAVEAGARVAMVQDGTLGGTCVNVGCVPSKTLIRAAMARHTRGHHPFDGIARSEEPVDWPVVRRNKDALVRELRGAKYEDVLEAYPDITLIPGRARLDAEGRVTLDDGTPVAGRAVIITTGSRPAVPDVPGLVDAGYLDSTALLDVDDLPASLAVLGAGSVGLELAQAYARLGVEVTILARTRLLSKEDPDVGEELKRHLEAEGIRVLTGVVPRRVERSGDVRIIHLRASSGDEVSVEAHQLLVATGRRPNSDDMGLEEAGVAVGPRGEIRVDASMRTSHPRVWAAGDVTGEPMHVYVAAYQAHIAAKNALGGSETVDLSVLPLVTFTDPGVATVGYTEARAREEGMEPRVSLLPMEHVPRALAARDTRGFIKLVADAGSRKILGAQIVGNEAWEMIMEPAMALRFGLTIDDITGMLHPYLTLSEGIKLAALTFEKDVAKLSCCAV